MHIDKWIVIHSAARQSLVNRVLRAAKQLARTRYQVAATVAASVVLEASLVPVEQ